MVARRVGADTSAARIVRSYRGCGARPRRHAAARCTILCLRVPSPCPRPILRCMRRRPPAALVAGAVRAGRRLLVAREHRQGARPHHALPGRGRAGQRRSPASRSALVKPGMTRAQVRDILGSPLLTDVFHADRWDYVFTIRRQGASRSAAGHRPLRRRHAEDRSQAPRTAGRARVRRLDRHLQDAAQAAAAGADRRADAGACRCRRRRRPTRRRRAWRCRRAPTRRSRPR